MTLEIELDSFNHLENGDCVEICGIVINEVFDIMFSSDNKPKFKFTINQTHGWDVCTWDRTTCDIDSGSNYSFLEYVDNYQFTLCFHIKGSQISTLLNDNLLSTTQTLTELEDINSIKIIGDNILRYISFSDCSKKTSRVLQPAILKSLELNINVDNNTVSIIESRKRIIFKTTFPDHDKGCLSESDNESDEDVVAMDVGEDNFKNVSTLLLNCSMSNDEEIYHQYPNNFPENKYVLNYFNPIEDISDSDDILMDSFRRRFMEMENPNKTKKNETFKELKSQLEHIRNNLENTSEEIEKFKSTPNLSNVGLKHLSLSTSNVCKTFQIPILKKDSPAVKLKISNHKTNNVNQNSKVPILFVHPPSISESQIKQQSISESMFDISKKRTYKLTKKPKKPTSDN